MTGAAARSLNGRIALAALAQLATNLLTVTAANPLHGSPTISPTSSPLVGAGRTPVRQAAASAAPGSVVNQCNPPAFPTGAGFEVTCNVTIVNTITPQGAPHSTVTTTSCLAAAGVVPPAGCTTTTTASNQLVTTVNQCNGIVYGGGSNLTCNVKVTNNIPFGMPTTGVTVNQCNGSGQDGVSPTGPTTICAPVASTTNATVVQCNGSANGGGAPLRVNCTVVGDVTAVPVAINQCNGSSNGGGSTVTCTTTITNNFISQAPVVIPPVVISPVVTPPRVVITRTLTLTPTATARASLTAGPDARLPLDSQSQAASTSLPLTGSNTTPMMILALMAMTLGGLLVLLSRRESKDPTSR